jgi:hypothetical protein
MHFVESYRFWDVAALWARERGDDEIAAARALARGVIADGLRTESVDPRWLVADHPPVGYPHVGYCAVASAPPVLLRVEALEHLLAVARRNVLPSREVLAFEFIFRSDFQAWLRTTGQPLPRFWFTDVERAVEA